MAAETFCFNINKGRGVELYNRVENNDPAAARFQLIPMSAGGTEAEGQDLDDMTAIEAHASFAEQVTSWTRKNLTDTELAAFPSPDDGNNRYDVSVPQVTWTAPSTNTAQLIVVYDAAGDGGQDVVPVTAHIFAVTGDSNDVVLNSGVFLRAT